MPPKAKQSKAFYSDRKKFFEILYNIVESTEELTIAQILSTLMRKKSEHIDPYFFSDRKMIQRGQEFLADVFENPLDSLEQDY